MTPEELLKKAEEAMQSAYAPYSRHFVGAALEAENGKVYTGCNVENAAFTPTCCAERTAVFKAVSEGVREFRALAVVGGKGGKIDGLFPPCGVCRQVLLEFCGKDFPVYLGEGGGKYRAVTLGELIPYGFTADDCMKTDG